MNNPNEELLQQLNKMNEQGIEVLLQRRNHKRLQSVWRQESKQMLNNIMQQLSQTTTSSSNQSPLVDSPVWKGLLDQLSKKR